MNVRLYASNVDGITSAYIAIEKVILPDIFAVKYVIIVQAQEQGLS